MVEHQLSSDLGVLGMFGTVFIIVEGYALIILKMDLCFGLWITLGI